ncbi:MAG: energy transducer TonB [Bacteroidota bacterium]
MPSLRYLLLLLTPGSAPLALAQDADQLPQIAGGFDTIFQERRYPKLAKMAGIEGTVVVQFVVTEEGTVEDAEVTRGLDGGLSEEALRVVRGLTFEPGLKDGAPTKVQLTLPIQFRLPDDEQDGDPDR